MFTSIFFILTHTFCTAFFIGTLMLANWYIAMFCYILNNDTTAIIGQLTQAIRNFAKNLEGWLKNALVGAPDDIIRIKASDVLL